MTLFVVTMRREIDLSEGIAGPGWVTVPFDNLAIRSGDRGGDCRNSGSFLKVVESEADGERVGDQALCCNRSCDCHSPWTIAAFSYHKGSKNKRHTKVVFRFIYP